MSYHVLARKWRPRSFPEMIGQAHVLRALVNALDNDRLHHAFLFTGTRGVGKTTIARILAKSLNCEQGVTSRPCGECESCRAIDEGRFVDLIEVDAASRTKVEDTRELLENVQYAPTRGRYKVYLVDEVHMLSTHSFNALLKTLEEPPPHVKFLLATTDPQRLPVTILSRCLQFNLKRLPAEAIRGHIGRVLEEEGVEAEAPAVMEIARAADGSMRDALSLLDQAIAYGNGRLVSAEVRDMLGTVDRDRVLALIDALADGDGARLLAEAQAMADFAPDYDAVLSELTAFLHRTALMQAVPKALGEEEADRERLEGLAARISREDVQLFYQIGVIGRRDLPLAPDPRSGFEMILLRMLAFRPAEGQTAAAPAGGAGAPGHPRTSGRPAPQDTRAQRTTARHDSARDERPPAPSAPEPIPTPQPLESNVAQARDGGSGEMDWAATVEALGLTGVGRQLALNSVPERDDGDRLDLVVDPVCEGLMSEQRHASLQAALSKHRGHEVRVTLRVSGAASETPARQAQRASDERLQAAEASIENDPDLQNLLDRFDGRIEPGSVRPVD